MNTEIESFILFTSRRNTQQNTQHNNNLLRGFLREALEKILKEKDGSREKYPKERAS